MPAVPEVVELTDARAIRAIAHPARLLVIDVLYDQGRELTATQAAELAGITPSAMSYHLRALERFGVVRRAEPSGDGRERPWVRAAKDLRIRPPEPTSTRAVALATSAVLSTAMDVYRERLLASMERGLVGGEGKLPLDAAASYMHTSVLVTPDEAQALMCAITELIEPLRLENRADPPDEAGRLSLVVSSVPDPDTDTDTEPPGPSAPSASAAEQRS